MSWLKRIILVVVILVSGMGYFWTQKRPKEGAEPLNLTVTFRKVPTPEVVLDGVNLTQELDVWLYKCQREQGQHNKLKPWSKALSYGTVSFRVDNYGIYDLVAKDERGDEILSKELKFEGKPEVEIEREWIEFWKKGSIFSFTLSLKNTGDIAACPSQAKLLFVDCEIIAELSGYFGKKLLKQRWFEPKEVVYYKYSEDQSAYLKAGRRVSPDDFSIEPGQYRGKLIIFDKFQNLLSEKDVEITIPEEKR